MLFAGSSQAAIMAKRASGFMSANQEALTKAGLDQTWASLCMMAQKPPSPHETKLLQRENQVQKVAIWSECPVTLQMTTNGREGLKHITGGPMQPHALAWGLQACQDDPNPHCVVHIDALTAQRSAVPGSQAASSLRISFHGF